jgi:hypothetical protein
MAELRVKSTGTLKLFESDNTSSVTIASPASLGGDRTITLPDASVTLASGTMLATDGSGASLTALNASELGSGTVPTARLGTGTASSSTVLYGDQTYKTEPTGGKILQVVSATDSTQVGTTSTSFVTESNTLSVDITPSATSSKIYVVYSTACYFTENTSSLYTTLYRDSTNLGDTNWGLTRLYLTAEDLTTNHMANYLDSPSSTSAITYQVYFRVLAGTGYMISQPKSVITAMEVGV